MTFFVIALVISVVITTAVIKVREVDDLRETRVSIDENASTLSVILQYSISSCTYRTANGTEVTLEHRSVLSLLEFCLTNLELNLSHNTTDIGKKVRQELDGVLGNSYLLKADSANFNITIGFDRPVKEKTVTSLVSPASSDLGGKIRITFTGYD